MAGFFKGLFGKRGKLVKGKNLPPTAGKKRRPSMSPLKRAAASADHQEAGPIKQEATGPFEPGEASPLQRVGTGSYHLEANRRKCERVPLQEWARCVGAGGRERSEQVLDLSVGGLRLKQSSMFQLYAQMEVFLPLPSDGPAGPVLCPVEGVIVWRNQHGMGIKFSELSDETVARLRQFIETLET